MNGDERPEDILRSPGIEAGRSVSEDYLFDEFLEEENERASKVLIDRVEHVLPVDLDRYWDRDALEELLLLSRDLRIHEKLWRGVVHLNVLPYKSSHIKDKQAARLAFHLMSIVKAERVSLLIVKYEVGTLISDVFARMINGGSLPSCPDLAVQALVRLTDLDYSLAALFLSKAVLLAIAYPKMVDFPSSGTVAEADCCSGSLRETNDYKLILSHFRCRIRSRGIKGSFGCHVRMLLVIGSQVSRSCRSVPVYNSRGRVSPVAHYLLLLASV